MSKKIIAVAFITVFGLEVTARLLPVEQGYFLSDVTDTDPVAHREPSRQATASSGWRLENPRSRRLNNEGFLHDDDYENGAGTPLVAIIGDSQVDAPGVDFPDTVQARLAKRGTWASRFYTFGMSGAPLSQYVVWTDYARKSFAPDAVIFVISPNDFHESFDEAGLFEGFHYFVSSDNGRYRLSLRPHRRSLRSRLVEHSHLLAYLVHNLGVPEWIRSAFADADVLSDRKIRFLTDWFFAELNAFGLGPQNTAFVLSPLSDRIYLQPECQPSSSGHPMATFKAAASQRDYPVVDLAANFCNDYRDNGKELEFPGDVHWNAEGHRVLADAIMEVLDKIAPNR